MSLLFYIHYCFHTQIIAVAEQVKGRFPKISFMLKPLVRGTSVPLTAKAKFRVVVEGIKKYHKRSQWELEGTLVEINFC